jgi:hypothetical protein
MSALRRPLTNSANSDSGQGIARPKALGRGAFIADFARFSGVGTHRLACCRANLALTPAVSFKLTCVVSFSPLFGPNGFSASQAASKAASAAAAASDVFGEVPLVQSQEISGRKWTR